MNDREALDPIPDLDGDLAALDAELRAIRMAERPSFGTELRAELSRHHDSSGEWIRPSSPGRWAVVAATAAAILFAIAAVAAAVTSISVLIERLQP